MSVPAGLSLAIEYDDGAEFSRCIAKCGLPNCGAPCATSVGARPRVPAQPDPRFRTAGSGASIPRRQNSLPLKPSSPANQVSVKKRLVGISTSCHQHCQPSGISIGRGGRGNRTLALTQGGFLPPACACRSLPALQLPEPGPAVSEPGQLAQKHGCQPGMGRICNLPWRANETKSLTIQYCQPMQHRMDAQTFRVKPGTAVQLDRWPTRIEPNYDNKKDYKQKLAASTRQLIKLQRLLYAHDRYSLLVIFQAMDAAGKDGAIRHVMSGVNPQGCQVFSFKHPSAKELDHDFLWRTNQALPERGRIGIFNRSYYEEVLIVRVRPEILAHQKLPMEHLGAEEFWAGRFRSIVEAESHLHRSGTRIVKFFLHLSKEEQCRRFLDRIDDPDKNWKFTRADIEQRDSWDAYMRAYEACFQATSTNASPWYVIPADDKRMARQLVSEVLVATLKELPLSYPATTAEWQANMQDIRRQLAAELAKE